MRDITLCHPRLQKLAVQLVESANRQNLKIKIGETFRTVAEQDALYAQGRTKPGKIVTKNTGKELQLLPSMGNCIWRFIAMTVMGRIMRVGNFLSALGRLESL